MTTPYVSNSLYLRYATDILSKEKYHEIIRPVMQNGAFYPHLVGTWRSGDIYGSGFYCDGLDGYVSRLTTYGLVVKPPNGALKTTTINGNGITSEGNVTASGKLLTDSQIGYTTAYSTNQIQIYCQWKDSSNHNILTREKDGLTLYLGWGGSSSYKTKTIIRGQTVQYTNSSGTSTLSDERLKNSFKNLNGYDEVFMNMKPVAYRYNNGSSGRFHFGFKAQNIRDALLKAGFTTQDFGGIVQMEDDPASEDYCGVPDPLGLIYTEFTAWNTHMIQKTALRVNRHDEEILELRQRVNDLERRLEVAEQKAVA